jgi:hypothetical protein
MPLTLDSPLVLYSIPVAWAVANLPATGRALAIVGLTGTYDNGKSLQHNIDMLAKKDVPPVAIERVRRIAAIAQNGIEGLPLWVGAVVRVPRDHPADTKAERSWQACILGLTTGQ